MTSTTGSPLEVHQRTLQSYAEMFLEDGRHKLLSSYAVQQIQQTNRQTKIYQDATHRVKKPSANKDAQKMLLAPKLEIDGPKRERNDDDKEMAVKKKRKKPTRRNGVKQNNVAYTFEQLMFVRYHKEDLGMEWKAVTSLFRERWPAPADKPHPERTLAGLESVFYRDNLRLPEMTDDGFMILDREGQPGQKKAETYEGFPFKTRVVKCREAKIPLSDAFPMELLNPANDYILPEHRELWRDRERISRQIQAFKHNEHMMQQQQMDQMFPTPPSHLLF
ncbi:hypothetical protein B0H63DRAFT_279489 [Podospora didyma]|uniref:Uncharacterized protein n=1 Tax=Podospora didyma TaxID=330526 RepID=A0AAE0KGA6_9PEZI|nr:hypothetical protein B0H63DRAFT_279489 [Podospora didyma]